MASYHYIPRAAIGLSADAEDYNEEEAARRLTAYITAKRVALKRGDIIGLCEEEDRYRNDDCFLFDGEKVIRLYYGVDEYGSLPPSMVVSDDEFSIKHWENAIQHNATFWLAPAIRRRIKLMWSASLGLYTGLVTIGGVMHSVLIEPSEGAEAMSKEDILRDLCNGRYFFDLSPREFEGEWKAAPARRFYAIRRPATELEDDASAVEEMEDGCFKAGWKP